MQVNQIRIFLWSLLALTLASCGGSGGESSSPTSNQNTTSAALANPPPETASLDIVLQGEPAVYLNIGDEYIEMGAAAFDENGEEISSSIEPTGNVNTNLAGDYLLKYSVSNDGLSGSTIRIVRVTGASPVKQTRRLNTSANANLSYLEHLPSDYATSTNLKAPLIIFNHGSGATGTGRLVDVECCGLPAVFDYSEWDDSLPFVALSPHRNRAIDYEDLNEFVEFALKNYAVDPNRVYMTGWSQGGYISVLYAIAYPEKVAALAPLAGGLFDGVPSNICDAAAIPMWTYIGGRDSSIIENIAVDTVNALNNCPQGERKMLTTFSGAGHFETSIWPFLPQGNHQTDSDRDPITEDLFQWFLSHSN